MDKSKGKIFLNNIGDDLNKTLTEKNAKLEGVRTF